PPLREPAPQEAPSPDSARNIQSAVRPYAIVRPRSNRRFHPAWNGCRRTTESRKDPLIDLDEHLFHQAGAGFGGQHVDGGLAVETLPRFPQPAPGAFPFAEHLLGHGRDPGHAHGLRSEEHTSELQSLTNLVCRLLLE